MTGREKIIKDYPELKSAANNYEIIDYLMSLSKEIAICNYCKYKDCKCWDYKEMHCVSGINNFIINEVEE